MSEILSHERERFVLAHLAAPEGPHRPLVERVAGEVVASEALDGDDGPSPQHPGRAQDGVVRFCVQPVAELIQQPYPWSAGRAGVGLGVEAAVGGIVVLALAFGAHLEAGHRGRGPVVRNRAGYGEAGTTVGAVGERVAVAAVRGVEDLPQALFAGGDIRRYERPPPDALPALLDPETPLAQRCERTPGTASTTASGGASSSIPRRKRSSLSASPSTSTWTPSASLRTSPASPCRRARA